MYIILISIIINYLIGRIVYNITDKKYYKCSRSTHIFGYILPILINIFIIYLYLTNKINVSLDYYLALLILSLSTAMGGFHNGYENDK